MSWDKAKNWVFGGGGAVAFVLFMGFVDWRVGVKVDAALAAMDLGTDAKIVEMDKVAASNTRTGEENAKDIAENKQAVRDAFRVLMEGDQ